MNTNVVLSDLPASICLYDFPKPFGASPPRWIIYDAIITISATLEKWCSQPLMDPEWILMDHNLCDMMGVKPHAYTIREWFVTRGIPRQLQWHADDQRVVVPRAQLMLCERFRCVYAALQKMVATREFGGFINELWPLISEQMIAPLAWRPKHLKYEF